MNTKYPPLDCCKFIGTIPIYSHSIKTRRTKTTRMFDLLSPFYDTIVPVITRLRLRRVASIRSKVLAQIDVKREHRLLDVGIGTGINWLYLKPIPRSIMGVDPSMGMLRRCARRFQKLGIQGELFCHSAEQLHFGNDEFDRIVCIGVLEYIPSYHQVLKEMLRVLKPTGKLIVIVASSWLSQQEKPFVQRTDQQIEITELAKGLITVIAIQPRCPYFPSYYPSET